MSGVIGTFNNPYQIPPRDGRKAHPDRIRTRPGTCGPGKTRPACMKKADPGIDFQCSAVSGHGSGHSTKNPEPGPVLAFLLSKKKRRKI